MATISREAIEALAKNRPTKEVKIPGLPELARLRKMSIADQRRIAALSAKEGVSDTDAAVEVLVGCWVDDAGAPMFVGSEGRSLLEELPIEILRGLCLEATEFSGLNPGADEGAEKN